MCYQLHKPDSVTPPKRCCYHLSTTAIADCLHLPTLERLAGGEVRRAAFIHSYTWHFSTQGLPMAGLATNHRELLPPVFTLTPPPYPRRGMNSKAVIFCGTVSTRLPGCPAVSGMGCPSLSGLSSPALQQQR